MVSDKLKKMSNWNLSIKGMIVQPLGIRFIIFEHVQNLTTGYNRLRSPKIGSNRSLAHHRDPHTARLSRISWAIVDYHLKQNRAV